MCRLQQCLIPHNDKLATVLKPRDYTQYDAQMKSDLTDWIRYHLALWQAPKTLHRLLQNQINLAQLTTKQKKRLQSVQTRQINQVLAWLKASKAHHVMRICDSDYPPRLKTITDPPPLLYIVGDRSHLKDPQIAIVGSRRPTLNGQQIARDFATSLARHGLIITSGLARGIDTAAHHGAVTQQKPTIAVCGCGVDVIYPKKNYQLYTACHSHGAVISEYPLGTPPLAPHFPRRNRLISGLSTSVLVIEAAKRSGSLITAYSALDQGRDVLAVPGSIRQPQSAGCHQLIQEGAKLVTCISDITDEMDINLQQEHTLLTDTLPNTLDKADQMLLECLGFESWSVQELCDHLDVSPQNLCSQLLKLELHGYIKAVPGGVSRVK